MENIIIVFNNRNYTMQLATYLKRMGVQCKTIDTPRELSISCGISVVIAKNSLTRAKQILNNSGIREMPKFYLVVSNGLFKKYIAI